MTAACVLGILGHANAELGTLEFKRFDRVIADPRPLAVPEAVLDVLRYARFDFITRQVFG